MPRALRRGCGAALRYRAPRARLSCPCTRLRTLATAPTPPPTAADPAGALQGREVLLPSHISVRDLARRLGKRHTAKHIAAAVCTLHRRQRYWLHVPDGGPQPQPQQEQEVPGGLEQPGEIYVLDRLSRVLLPHSVAADYARQVGFTPRFQHLEPLAVQRDPLPIASAEGSSGGGEVQVVVILGHADHGKTSLLDCLRGSDAAQPIAPTEAGAITQRVSACARQPPHPLPHPGDYRRD